MTSPFANTFSILSAFIIVTVSVLSFQRTVYPKFSAIKRIGNIVRSLIMTGVTSSVFSSPLRYADFEPIVSLISFSPYFSVAVCEFSSQFTLPPTPSTKARTGRSVLSLVTMGTVPFSSMFCSVPLIVITGFPICIVTVVFAVSLTSAMAAASAPLILSVLGKPLYAAVKRGTASILSFVRPCAYPCFTLSASSLSLPPCASITARSIRI